MLEVVTVGLNPLTDKLAKNVFQIHRADGAGRGRGIATDVSLDGVEIADEYLAFRDKWRGTCFG